MRIQPGTGLCNPCRSLIAFRALPVPSNTGRSTLLQPRHVKARVQQLHLCAKPGNEETVGEDDVRAVTYMQKRQSKRNLCCLSPLLPAPSNP